MPGFDFLSGTYNLVSQIAPGKRGLQRTLVPGKHRRDPGPALVANIQIFTRFCIYKISTHAEFLPSTTVQMRSPKWPNMGLPLNTFVSRPTAVAHVSTSLASTTASSIKSTFGAGEMKGYK